MRNCPNPRCKNVITNDSAIFCIKCGTRLPPIDQHPTNSTAEEVSENPALSSNGRNNYSQHGFAGGGVVLGSDISMPSTEAPKSMASMGGGVVVGGNISVPKPSGSNSSNYGYGGGNGMPVTKPRSYMVLAILTTLFCSLILGIVSIVYASKVDSLYYAGDYQGAVKASKKAKWWSVSAIIVGVIMTLILIILANS